MAGFTPSFIGGPIAGFLAREMPAAAIRFAITVLGNLGHQLNLLMALSIGAGALAVVVSYFVTRASGSRRTAGARSAASGARSRSASAGTSSVPRAAPTAGRSTRRTTSVTSR